MYKKHERGFTLIELLVVIAIIGVLSSVVLASLNTARTKSRDAKRVADIKQVQLALELYFDDIKNYPVLTTAGAIPAALAPTYIAVIPADPLPTAANPYNYISSAGGISYCVGADLENATNALHLCTSPDLGVAYDYELAP